MAKNKKRPRPIAPKPIQMKSRKKARKVTSLFHKLTSQIDQAKRKQENADNGNNAEALNEIRLLEQQIDDMGGREEYQRASQLSTKFHSTSKWVLKVLGQKGWLHGRVVDEGDHAEEQGKEVNKSVRIKQKHQKKRTVNILEIGAINIELLTAASKTKRVTMKKLPPMKETNENDKRDSVSLSSKMTTPDIQKYKNVPMFNISVRAIDIRSSHELIEEQDFLTLPVPTATGEGRHYDVVVCSMVLNCVTSPKDRGKMLSLMYEHLCPGGLCFLTIPKLCLSQSKYIDRVLFEKILQDGVGFNIVEKKESPKVAFWVLSKEEEGTMRKKNMTTTMAENCKDEWSNLIILHRGKKYRNNFSVVL